MNEILRSPVFIWLAFMIVFIVVEIITVGLTSIWFAGGAFTALLAALAGLSPVLQTVSFFAVSLILLFVLKYVKPHNVKTNYEDVIGREVQVTRRIDNRAQTGTAVCNGLEWTARSVDDGIVIEAGETAVAVEIKGVKLFVKPIKEV